MSKMVINIVFFLLFISCSNKNSNQGNVLNEPLVVNVKGLDPAAITDLYQNKVASNIYESLFQYHYLKRPYELIPALAEAMPVTSNNGLTHTIKIKKGIKFQDDVCFKDGLGRELKAKDFIYAWKRIANPKTKSQNYWLIEDKIKGLDQWRKDVIADQANFSKDVSGFEVVDDYTLKINLLIPYFQLYYVLEMVVMAPVPRECVDHYGEDFLNHPIGTGPFKIKKWVHNSKIILEKNQNFRDEFYPSSGATGDQDKGLLVDAGKKLPLLDGIIYHEIIESQPMWLKFLKGRLDISAIPKDSFDNSYDMITKQVKGKLKEVGGLAQVYVTPDTTFNKFNMEHEILGKNKKLRQAMSLARDREWIIKNLYNGRAVAAQSPIPPGMDGYDPTFKNPYSKYDLKKAKQLMAEAGYPNGEGLPEFTLDITSSSTGRQFAERFIQDVAAIGIKLKTRVGTWPEFMERVKKKKAEIFGYAWGADYPDAQNFYQLFYSKNSSPGPNGSNFKNAQFDKIYEQSLMLPPGNKRTKLYTQLREIVVEEAPWIFMTHRIGLAAYHPWLKNLKPDRIISGKNKYIRLDRPVEK